MSKTYRPSIKNILWYIIDLIERFHDILIYRIIADNWILSILSLQEWFTKETTNFTMTIDCMQRLENKICLYLIYTM